MVDNSGWKDDSQDGLIRYKLLKKSMTGTQTDTQTNCTDGVITPSDMVHVELIQTALYLFVIT